MDAIKIKMSKNKTTKGTFRFAGELAGRDISIYLPKEKVPADLEEVTVTIK